MQARATGSGANADVTCSLQQTGPAECRQLELVQSEQAGQRLCAGWQAM